MKESFNIPHADRAVGERPEHRADFEEWLTKKFLQGAKKIENLELDKTPRDLEIIDFADKSVSSYLQEYGREKYIAVPLENIHLLVKGGVEKYTEGRQVEAVAASILGSLLVDRSESDIEFAIKLFHELTHLKSYRALQVTSGDRRLRAYRAGFSVTTRDGNTKYFEDFEEAVVSMFTERFYKEKIVTSELFQDELAKQEREPYISRQKEVKELNELIDKLWELNKDNFDNREEVLGLFINAQINGRLFPVARLIEKTFGRGSFRQLGTPKE